METALELNIRQMNSVWKPSTAINASVQILS